MRAEVLRRRAAAVVAAVALCVVLAAPPVEQTEAGWVDAEVGMGTFKSIVVPKPTYVSCSGTGILSLGASLIINWREAPNASELIVDYAQLDATGILQPITGLLLADTVVTTPVQNNPGMQKTVVNAGALGLLLGGTKTLYIRYSGPNGENDWKSDWFGVKGTWGIVAFSGCAPATPIAS